MNPDKMDEPLMLSRYQAALIAILLAWSANTHADTTLCQEIIPPAMITQPGIYCLLKDHVVNNASPAISIRANNVVLDLKGHRIGSGSRYYVAGTPSETAIEVNNAQNVTIRNGTIRGFATGISLLPDSSRGHLVEDMLIEGVSGFGIISNSNNSIFRRNRIFGLNPQPQGGSPEGTGGIYARGNGLLLQSNIIQNFTGKVNTYGIFASGTAMVIENNTISGILEPQIGLVYGISAGGQAVVNGNKVMNITSPKLGLTTIVGIHADGETLVINNAVSGVSGTPYAGGNQIFGTNF